MQATALVRVSVWTCSSLAQQTRPSSSMNDSSALSLAARRHQWVSAVCAVCHLQQITTPQGVSSQSITVSLACRMFNYAATGLSDSPPNIT